MGLIQKEGRSASASSGEECLDCCGAFAGKNARYHLDTTAGARKSAILADDAQFKPAVTAELIRARRKVMQASQAL